MAKSLAGSLEDAVRREETQDSTQGIRVDVNSSGKVGYRTRILIELVGDAEVGDDVKAAWQAISTSNLQQGLSWISVSHERLLEIIRPPNGLGILLARAIR
jgi:hypothetical protein